MQCLFFAFICKPWHWNFNIRIATGIGQDGELSCQYPSLHVIMWQVAIWPCDHVANENLYIWRSLVGCWLKVWRSQASSHMTFLIIPHFANEKLSIGISKFCRVMTFFWLAVTAQMKNLVTALPQHLWPPNLAGW